MTGMRRTAIARKTELRRTAPLRRRKALARTAAAHRTVEKQRKQRDTGPTRSTKELLWARAQGRCELCSRSLTHGEPFSRHHRRARGAGGSSVTWINDITNLLLVCGTATTPDGCHHLIETQKQIAYAAGWVVPMHGTHTPAEIPVDLARFPQPMYLTDDGDYAPGAP